MKTVYRYFSIITMLLLISITASAFNVNGKPPFGGKKKVKANFSYKEDSCKVSFIDKSKLKKNLKIKDWLWSFGDGKTSTLQNPTHIYATAGTYNVCLEITTKTLKGLVKDRECKRVEVKCGGNGTKCDLKPNFVFKVDSCKVVFANTSTAGTGTTITNWYWDFGDGQTDTTQQPTHVYTASGNYNVCLVIVGKNVNSQCKERICMKVNVNCGGNPGSNCKLNPNFTFKADSCKVVFANTSTAGTGTTITNWYWDFGDGQTDTTQQPTHVYTASRTYNVCLVIVGYNGKDKCKERICVKVEVKCGGNGTKCELKSNIKYKQHLCDVEFKDISTAGAGTTFTNNRHWDFGDGTTADTIKNPKHTYKKPGNYTVCLTVYGVNGNSYCKDYYCIKLDIDRCRGYSSDGNGNGLSADKMNDNLPDVIIYPNPAQSSTNIDFNLLTEGNVEVNVTDIHGKTVTTLVNKYLLSGTHKLNWLVDNNVPSGMYIIQIKTDKSIQRKELILIK